jgi:hypothetical protein
LESVLAEEPGQFITGPAPKQRIWAIVFAGLIPFVGVADVGHTLIAKAIRMKESFAL